MTRSIEDALAADVVDSSRGLPWPGLEVMTARIAHGGLEIDGLQTHTLALNIGPAFALGGRIDGRSVGGEMHHGAMKFIAAGPRSTWRWDARTPIEMLHVSIADDVLREGANELGVSGSPK